MSQSDPLEIVSNPRLKIPSQVRQKLLKDDPPRQTLINRIVDYIFTGILLILGTYLIFIKKHKIILEYNKTIISRSTLSNPKNPIHIEYAPLMKTLSGIIFKK